MTVRVCSKCGEPKPESEFYPRSDKPHLKCSHCASCQCEATNEYQRANAETVNAYQRRYREANREKVREQARQRNARLRAAAIAAYGGRCACCGEATPEFMSIDHINGRADAPHPKNFTGLKLYAWLARNGYPEGFQVLCMNCNCAKGFYGICPHQLQAREGVIA